MCGLNNPLLTGFARVYCAVADFADLLARHWYLPLLLIGAALLPLEGVIVLIAVVCLIGMYRLTDLPA